jgi:hypothetical protein
MSVNEVPDALFPTNNPWDIPTLYLPLQADFVDLPVRGWGSIKRKNSMRGTWHFYVDDYKFAALWKSPDVVLKTAAVSVVEVNYTTEDEMPMAMCLHRIFLKRWLARYWQSQGLRVFVDLNVAKKCDEINLLGVPDGWKSFATSGADYATDRLLTQESIALRKAGGVGPINFLVYGGGPKVAQLCAERGWIRIPDARNAARAEAPNA